MKDKKNIIIALLIIVIVCLTCFIVYDKLMVGMNKNTNTEEKEDIVEKNDENDSTTKESSSEDSSIELEEEQDVMNKIDVFVESTYKRNKLLASDIRSELKLQYSISKELQYNKNLKDLTPTGDELKTYSIRWPVVEKRVKSLFGKNTNFEIVSILKPSVVGVGCFNAERYCGYSEDDSQCSYSIKQFGCDVGWRFDSYKTKREKENKTNNSLEVYQKVLHIECNPGNNTCEVKTMMKDNESTNGIKEKPLGTVESANSSDINQYFEYAATFKYTFNLEDNYYYFVSSELV